jgi:hypothetical protein
MRFFLDRNMPPQLAKIVAAADPQTLIRHHNDDPRFHEKTTDIEWITTLGTDGVPPWVALSCDGWILKNRAERLCLKSANLTFFYLKQAWLHIPMEEKGWKFLRIWPLIKAAAQKIHTPSIFEIPINGTKFVNIGPTKNL